MMGCMFSDSWGRSWSGVFTAAAGRMTEGMGWGGPWGDGATATAATTTTTSNDWKICKTSFPTVVSWRFIAFFDAARYGLLWRIDTEIQNSEHFHIHTTEPIFWCVLPCQNVEMSPKLLIYQGQALRFPSYLIKAWAAVGRSASFSCWSSPQ